MTRTHGLGVILFVGTGSTHSIGFSGTRLSVGQNRNIVSLQEGIYAITEILPDALLVGGLGKNSIEDEDLAALGHIDGETGRGCDMDHRPLEALGNQFIARIAGFQRRPHTNG